MSLNMPAKLEREPVPKSGNGNLNPYKQDRGKDAGPKSAWQAGMSLNMLDQKGNLSLINRINGREPDPKTGGNLS